MNNQKVKVAICGGSGYTGAELLRLLALHPYVQVTAVTSEKSVNKSVAELFAHLQSYSHLKFEALNKEALLHKADVFFLALPHSSSAEAGDYFFSKGKKVIDLSADFRLEDPAVYEQWYKTKHHYGQTLKNAVYGLPEIYRLQIKSAQLVANPGCYPTCAILGLAPALKHQIIDAGSIIIDAKSGTSGAGRKAEIAYSFCEVNEGFKAYGIGVHRHTPEIEQELSKLAGRDVVINFTPHLVAMDRGILATMYARLADRAYSTEEVLEIYKRFYENEQFVRVLPEDTFPNAKSVRASNYCHIGLKVIKRTNTLIVVSAIDNLVKGASGQAIQNLNIMLGFDEATALNAEPVVP